jgi:hypothetical protein
MPRAGNYVGAVLGTDALLAIVVGKTSVVGYVCDSRTIASHFEGGRQGSGFRLLAPLAYHGRGYYGRLGTIRSLRPGGAVTFTLTARGLRGTVTIGGRAHRFVATRAPAWAGYYRAEGAMNGRSVYAGWVVAANGQQRGAVLNRNTGDIVAVIGPIEVRVQVGLTVQIGDTRSPVGQVTAGSLS